MQQETHDRSRPPRVRKRIVRRFLLMTAAAILAGGGTFAWIGHWPNYRIISHRMSQNDSVALLITYPADWVAWEEPHTYGPNIVNLRYPANRLPGWIGAGAEWAHLTPNTESWMVIWTEESVDLNAGADRVAALARQYLTSGHVCTVTTDRLRAGELVTLSVNQRGVAGGSVRVITVFTLRGAGAYRNVVMTYNDAPYENGRAQAVMRDVVSRLRLVHAQ